MSGEIQLPKLSFKTCDETSLTLQWDPSSINSLISTEKDGNSLYQLKIQYKEIHLDWKEASEYIINDHSSGVLNISNSSIAASLVDLKPGTPYFVRLVATKNSEESSQSVSIFGPHTVFDTKPIDCTPKKKSCLIS